MVSKSKIFRNIFDWVQQKKVRKIRKNIHFFNSYKIQIFSKKFDWIRCQNQKFSEIFSTGFSKKGKKNSKKYPFFKWSQNSNLFETIRLDTVSKSKNFRNICDLVQQKN